MKKLGHVLMVLMVIGMAIYLKVNGVLLSYHIDFKFDVNPGDAMVGCAATLVVLWMFNYTKKCAAEAKKLDAVFAHADSMLGRTTSIPQPVAIKPVVLKSSDPTPKVDSDKAAAARMRRQQQFHWEKIVPRPGEVQQVQKPEPQKPQVDILALMYNKNKVA